MATESNTGVNFHHHHHYHDHRAPSMSFQSSAGLEVGSYCGSHYGHGVNMNMNVNVSNAAGGIVISGTPTVVINSSSNNNPAIPQPGSSFGSLLLDSVPGLKQAGLAVEWCVEEQYKLEEGLVKFADEPTIMKYIKIAAVLRDKTVRDVALRCRWMMDRFGTSIASSSKMNMAAYSIPLQAHRQSDAASSGVSALIGSARRLLEENNQAFGRISSNLTALKLQENVDLFLWTRSNLTSILNDMRNMPGIMSQMPPLPVFINEELASYILPSSSQCMMFGSPIGLHLKQEPGC